MFYNHQPAVGEWARQDPANFAAVGAFVICTIKTPLERAILDYRAYQDHGDHAALWGWKLSAVQELEDHAAERLAQLEALQLGRPGDRDAMLGVVLSWTGFSYVKGGFLLQLAYGMSGCIDSHNEKRLGMNMRQAGFAHGPKTPKHKQRMVRRYHALVDQMGGSEVLWDDWCEFIARKRPDIWRDAFEVSRNHALGILPAGQLGDGYVGSDIPF